MWDTILYSKSYPFRAVTAALTTNCLKWATEHASACCKFRQFIPHFHKAHKWSCLVSSMTLPLPPEQFIKLLKCDGNHILCIFMREDASCIIPHIYLSILHICQWKLISLGIHTEVPWTLTSHDSSHRENFHLTVAR